jgi:hypothetical protein
MEWREIDGVRWLEAALPGSRAAFSTRGGGVSPAPYESLDLAVPGGGDPDSVRENRHRLVTALGLVVDRVVIGRQVHGAEIASHDGPQVPSPFSGPGPDPPQVDGHVIDQVGLASLVFVADCLPIALAGPGGVAMLHCGWRGLAAGIIAAGARRVEATAAAIGPGIGPCCYEVGPEVLAAFAALGEEIAVKRMLDLAEVARRQLDAAGVGAISAAGLCTSCNPELFFSHRRDGRRTGRQAGLAWIESEGSA